MATHAATSPTERTGFSLIEVVVVIGAIAIMLAIILPSLGKGRESAQRTLSLSNLRGISQLIQLYTERSDAAYPWVNKGVNGCGVPIMFSPIWQMDVQWPVAMHTFVEPAQLSPIKLAPGATRDAGGPFDPCGHPPSYYYSQSFLASPRLWSGNAVADDSLLGNVRAHMVAYPSAKCHMWEWELPYGPADPTRVGPDLVEPVPMLFADGHADQRTPAHASDPVHNPFLGTAIPTTRLHNTPDGVLGRDY